MKFMKREYLMANAGWCNHSNMVKTYQTSFYYGYYLVYKLVCKDLSQFSGTITVYHITSANETWFKLSWTSNLVMRFSSSVTFSKLVNYSEPQFCGLQVIVI